MPWNTIFRLMINFEFNSRPSEIVVIAILLQPNPDEAVNIQFLEICTRRIKLLAGIDCKTEREKKPLKKIRKNEYFFLLSLS